MGTDLVNKKKVGIYGGSFNPPHNGHLNLAVEIAEHRELDEIWFCPANINPFKADSNYTSIQHRLEMTRLAIAPFSNFKVIDIEAAREGISYTIDTLRQLIVEFGNHIEFSLLLGDDNIFSFPSWHRAEEIVKLVPLFIGRRENGGHFPEASPAIRDALERGITPTRVMEITATNIRERLQINRPCAHLIPGKVIDYINEHSLY